jgi:uncharacterized protein (TIGR04255 family)
LELAALSSDPLTETELPKYRKPPVSEVVMSIQFDSLGQLTPVHLGRWWTGERRERYPFCEERSPLPPSREDLGKPSPPTFSVSLFGVPPSPAVWFLAADRSELLQVQRDRFSRNWTRPSPEVAEYPSYDRLLPEFEQEFMEFSEFLMSENLGKPTPVQCELTYVNPLPAGQGWERLGQVGDIFAPWSGSYSDASLPEPEDIQVNTRFRIVTESGEPVGRLSIALQPGWAPDGGPLMLLTLTARGRPLSPDVTGVHRFLDLGHVWIVRGFTTLTTPHMHEIWERTQ